MVNGLDYLEVLLLHKFNILCMIVVISFAWMSSVKTLLKNEDKMVESSKSGISHNENSYDSWICWNFPTASATLFYCNSSNINGLKLVFTHWLSSILDDNQSQIIGNE